MADKRYNLKMTLTDGTELSAGVITAPQGPAGEGVPSGGTAGQFLQKTADGTAWANISGSEFEIISTEIQETTVTITGSAGSKQIEIIADVENVSSGQSSLVIRKELHLAMSPDGSYANEKEIFLSIYDGAISMGMSQGIDIMSMTPVIYDAYTTSAGSQTKIIVRDLNGISYPNGLSIANLPDTAQVVATYGIQGIRKIN